MALIKQSCVNYQLDYISTLPKRTKLQAKEIVSQAFKGSSEIQTLDIIVPLICPITQRRLEIPCIGAYCYHISCFDGKSFRQINRKRCPICHRRIEPGELKVDSLVESILSSTSPDCDRVSFDQNGNWRPFPKSCTKVSIEKIISLVGPSNGSKGIAIKQENDKSPGKPKIEQ